MTHLTAADLTSAELRDALQLAEVSAADKRDARAELNRRSAR